MTRANGLTPGYGEASPLTERYTRLQVPGLPGVFFREESIELAGREVSLLCASSVDVLSARTNGPIPYWPVAWPSGLALARVLAEMALTGKRVLEVGCGVGIGGLGAALAGADVLATDNEAPALRLALMNSRRNGMRIRAAAADWLAWPLRGRFDLVCGSDVTYEPAAFSALLELLEGSLALGGEVLLTDPGRVMAGTFLRQAEARGWEIESDEVAPNVMLHRLFRL